MGVTNVKKNHGLGRFLPEVLFLIFIGVVSARVGYMIYHDDVVDGSTFSNRSFFGPAIALSLLFVTYFCVRARFLPIGMRLGVSVPIAMAGYVVLGYFMILLNMWIDLS